MSRLSRRRWRKRRSEASCRTDYDGRGGLLRCAPFCVYALEEADMPRAVVNIIQATRPESYCKLTARHNVYL